MFKLIENCVYIVIAIIVIQFHLLCKESAFFAYGLYMGFKEGWEKGRDL